VSIAIFVHQIATHFPSKHDQIDQFCPPNRRLLVLLRRRRLLPCSPAAADIDKWGLSENGVSPRDVPRETLKCLVENG
jgi:hypothetical protein